VAGGREVIASQRSICEVLCAPQKQAKAGMWAGCISDWDLIPNRDFQKFAIMALSRLFTRTPPKAQKKLHNDMIIHHRVSLFNLGDVGRPRRFRR
jgi:hypothetical protein